MAQFKIEIAGMVFFVSSLFESTRDYCRNYLTEREAEFSIAVTREDLVFEQKALDEEAREEGLKRRNFSDPFLERAAIQRKVAGHLQSCGTLLFHGSGIALDGKGYLFAAARCGTGKSTHTGYWRQVFGSRCIMVNDDKPFLEITPAGVTMHGAPWSGKHGLDTNASVPLQGLCILERGSENRITRLSAEEATPMLLHQSLLPGETSASAEQAALVSALANTVPLWRMTCTKDPLAAEIAFDAMSSTH